MVFRLLTCGIVLFWAVMMGLLLQRDVFKSDMLSLSLPPEHVLRLMFLHGQDSNLEIQQDGESMGALSLHPETRNDEEIGRSHTLQINGNLMVVAGPDHQTMRVTGDALLYLSSTLELNRVRGRGGVKDREIEVVVDYDRITDHLKFQVLHRNVTLRQWEGKPVDLQTLPELTESGFSAGQLNNLRSQIGTPEIRATKGSVSMKGERVETYLIQVMHAEGIASSIYFSQLGQVLKVEVFSGQTMLGEGVDP